MLSDDVYRMALTHFAAGGVQAVSLASVATSVGVDLEEIVAAHDSTDSLFAVAVARATRALNAELSVLGTSDRPPAERLLLMTRRLATPSGHEGTALFAVFREMLDGHPRAESAFGAALSEGFDAFVRVIGEAQFRGEVKPLPPRFILSVLLSGVVLPQLIGFGGVEGALHGVHARDDDAAEDDPATPPRSALLAASLEATFNGIASSPAPARSEATTE